MEKKQFILQQYQSLKRLRNDAGNHLFQLFQSRFFFFRLKFAFQIQKKKEKQFHFSTKRKQGSRGIDPNSITLVVVVN